MRKREYQRAMMRRIAKAEAASHAAILRAFRRVLETLKREETEYLIYLDRHRKRK